MAAKFRKVWNHFFMVTKKGYDDTNWIFMIIAGAGIITKLFGIGGAVAAIIAFALFYLFGRMGLRREKRLAEEEENTKKRARKR